MTILEMDGLTVSELEKRLKDKIKSLREMEAKIEMLYEVGDTDYVDHLDMISGVVIEDILEIEDLLKLKKEG